MEGRYPFRFWSRDLLNWAILNNDLEPPRQAAAVLGELRGSAQEFAREIPPQIILQGGMVGGTQVDPLTYVVTHLAERFAVLGEESRLAAMTELMTFSRRQGETIDQLLSRFDLVRQRAQDLGGFGLTPEGFSWLLLRACGVNDTQLLQLLHPLQGRLPQNLQQYRELQQSLRRMGHILEHSPANIGA